MYRVLICDDQKDIVNALKIYLAPEGYQLLEKTVYEGGIAPGEKLIVERTVVNAPVFELPMTGSTGSTTATILQLAGAVTLLAMLLYLVKKRC